MLIKKNFADTYYDLLRMGLFCSGILFIIAGLLFNSYFFATYVSLDGVLESSTKRIIHVFQFFFVFIGIVFSILSHEIRFFSPQNKNRVINSSLFFLSLLFIAGAAEFSLRVVSSYQPVFTISGTDPAVFQASSIIPWELKPNTTDRFVALDFDTMVSINSLGLRGNEHLVNKTKGTYRVLVLGDSMTYGFGVEDNETYAAVLEDMLRAEGLNKTVEVWNAGFTAGYSPDTFFIYFREKGVHFNPDLVLLGLFVENDVVDLWKNAPVMDGQGKILKITSDFYRVQNNRLRRGFSTDEPSQVTRVLLYVKGVLLKYLKLYSYLNQKWSLFLAEENNPIFDKEYSGSVNKNFDQVDFYLGEMKNLADKNRIRLAVAFLPGKASVEELWQSYVKKNPESSREKPRERLKSFCEKYTISCVDLWPAFMHANNSASLFFEHDGHWNSKGQTYAAGLIKNFFIAEQFVR